MDNRKFYWALLIIGTAGLILRVHGFVFSVDYDEIWSLEYYANQSVRHIFTDIATPNNHPLNSLQMKYTMNILFPWSIRLIPFLCGVLLAPLAGLIGRRFWNWRVGLCCALLVAVSPPLIQYSSLARGYSMQLFLLALCGYALSRLNRQSFEAKYAVLLLVGGIASILTLATSVLYLLPAGLWLLWLAWRYFSGAERRRGWILLATAGGLALFTALWFLANLGAYLQFKGWGESLTAITFFPWTVKLFSTLGVPVYLVGAAGIIAVYRQKKNMAVVLMILLPLLTAFFTNAGPARSFLPLLLLAIFLIGVMIDQVWSLRNPLAKWLAVILLAAVCAGSLSTHSLWTQNDWVRIFQAAKTIPHNTLIIYGANESYSLSWNNEPLIAEDYKERVSAPAEQIELLALASDNREYTALDSAGNVRSIILPEGGEVVNLDSLPFTFYRLEQLTDSPVQGDLLLLQIRPVPDADYRRLQKEFWDKDDKLLICSCWLNRVLSVGRQKFRYILAIMRLEASSEIDFLKLQSESNGAISVYRIRPMPDPR